MKDRINERNGKNMSGLLENVQPAVKKETKRVVMITGAGLILMWILFAILHFTMPDKVPFDYTVILGGIGGGVIAVLNFFLMGLAVQKAASATDEGTACTRSVPCSSRWRPRSRHGSMNCISARTVPAALSAAWRATMYMI